MARTTGIRFRSLLMAALFVTVSCAATEKSSDSKPPTDFEIRYSHVWSAAQGIDLFSRGAELVRATREAEWYSNFVGRKNSYPGFEQAYPAWDDPLNTSDNLMPLKPPRRSLKSGPPAGRTYYMHLVNLIQDDHKVSATFCDYHVDPQIDWYEYPEDQGQYKFGGTIDVQLTNGDAEPGHPGKVDTNPDTTDPNSHMPPKRDIFQNWNITRFYARAYQDSSKECGDWLHKQFPAFETSSNGGYLLPTREQIPTAPSRPQFPDWIDS